MDFQAAIGLACANAHLFVEERLLCGRLFIANVTSFGFRRHFGRNVGKEGKESRKGRRKGHTLFIEIRMANNYLKRNTYFNFFIYFPTAEAKMKANFVCV